jgi:hypothetical protein
MWYILVRNGKRADVNFLSAYFMYRREINLGSETLRHWKGGGGGGSIQCDPFLSVTTPALYVWCTVYCVCIIRYPLISYLSGWGIKSKFIVEKHEWYFWTAYFIPKYTLIGFNLQCKGKEAKLSISGDHFPPNVPTREYWIIYRGPRLSWRRMIGSSPPLPSVRSTGDKQEDW